MALTTLARNYRDKYRQKPTKSGVLASRLVALTGYSKAHVYNVIRGTRRSAPLEQLISDIKNGVVQ